MSEHLTTLRAALAAAIAAAHDGRQGDLSSIEPPVLAFAKAHREIRTPVSDVVAEVKGLLQVHAGQHAGPFAPTVVAWTLAGYYA
jgi:hypothetical protein